MGPPQADRALDDPNLAIRVCHWSSRLFNALPMVPSAGALTVVASAVFTGLPGYADSRCAEGRAGYADEPANDSNVKILRSTAI